MNLFDLDFFPFLLCSVTHLYFNSTAETKINKKEKWVDMARPTSTHYGLQSLYEMLLYEVYMSESIDWNNVIKKEARGLDDYDLGEVQELIEEYVVTKRGVVDKDKFYLPKNKAVKFDTDKLWFSVSKDDAKAYKRD